MDLVPKTIMHFLVNNFKYSLQNELVTQLYKEQIMTDLMRETEDIASKRKVRTKLSIRSVLKFTWYIMFSIHQYSIGIQRDERAS